jgi:hypothetical protein
MTTPYPCHCLVVLRDEADKAHPGRDKRSDGWIGDQTHQSTGSPENGGSKHNPNRHGAVDARDFDNSNIDIARFVACAIKHPSTRNVIYNRKIRSKGYSGGLAVAHAYNGPSPHTEHIHVDIEMTVGQENDSRAWGYYTGGQGGGVVTPVVVVTHSSSGAGGMTKMPTLRRNPSAKLSSVKTLQRGLTRVGFSVGNAGADGSFGNGTLAAVRGFQRKYKLTVDGVVGPKTWVALAQALLVKAGQSISVDGGFGPKTAGAVAAFQKAVKITADSVVGPVTWTKLLTYVKPAAKA